VDLEVVGRKRLGHLDADVPAADDPDRSVARLEELAGRATVRLLEVPFRAGPPDVLAECLAVTVRSDGSTSITS